MTIYFHKITKLLYKMTNYFHKMTNLRHKMANYLLKMTNSLHKMTNLLHKMTNYLHKMINLLVFSSVWQTIKKWRPSSGLFGPVHNPIRAHERGHG